MFWLMTLQFHSTASYEEHVPDSIAVDASDAAEILPRFCRRRVETNCSQIRSGTSLPQGAGSLDFLFFLYWLQYSLKNLQLSLFKDKQYPWSG